MAFGVLTFDELNKLVGMKRSEPFEEYFAPMKISDEQKRERIRLAESLEDEFAYMMSYMFYAYPNINVEMADELRDRYMEQLVLLGIAVGAADRIAEYEMQTQKFALEAIESTQRHKEDPYYYSEDRARLCAEDQSNFIYDIKEYGDALDAGYMYKTWETVGDNRVRSSHVEIEGTTIPLEEPFVLWGGLMMHPHDDSLGVDENELIGCRCSLSFSKEHP